MLRPLLLVCITALAIAAEAPIAWAVWTGDPTTTVTVRVLARTVPERLRATPENGAGRELPVVRRAIAGWQVGEIAIDGLAPGTLCRVDDGAGGEILRVRTATGRLPMRFVSGGDLMHRPEWMRAMSLAAARRDPEFAVIGGDWAYDDADPAHFDRWVDLLRIWRETMVRSDGSAVPMVAAIGNHEMPRGGGGDATRTPFAALFPEPMVRTVTVGPEVAFVLLDTGHARPIADQTAWLATQAAALRPRAWTFAVYHVPAYPSVRKFDGSGSSAVRARWVPVFEREGVDAVFEAHDHALKRTHPLLGGRTDPAGITYLGDGCWGVEPRTPATPAERPYLAVSAAVHHVWSIALDAGQAQCEAIGADGAVLDRVTLTPRR